MSLATLSIDLEARLAEFEEGMDRAARISEKNAAQIRRTFDDLKSVTSTIGASLTAAFAGFSITQFIRGTVDGIDALNDLKDATGSSIESLSALEDVALRGGTSVEQMSTALIKFNKVLTEAKPDNETGRIIKSIGLDVQQLKEVDPAEALRQVAVALSRYADDGNKARIVQELFGKSTKDVAKFLKDLADQGTLVATVTAKRAEESKRFNDQLDALKKNSVDTARSLVSELLPALNGILESYIKLGGLKGTVSAVFGFDDMSKASAKAEALQASVKLTGDRIAAMSEELRRDPGNDFLRARIDKARERLAALQKEASQASDTLKQLAGDFQPLPGDFSNKGRNAPKPSLKVPEKTESPVPRKEQISEASRALATYIDQLDRQLEKEKDLTESQKALNFLKELGTVGEIPQVRELVLSLANEKDMREALTKITQEQTAAQEEQAKQLRALDQEIDNFSGAATERRKQELTARLEERLKSGEAFAPDRLEAIVKAIGAIGPQLDKTSSDIDEFTKRAAANIQDSLGETLKATLTGDFASIGDRWKNLILDMIAQAAAAKLGKVLLGDFAKTGDIGGIFGDALKWLAGAFGSSSGTVSGQISPGGDYDIGLAAAPSSPMVIQGIGSRARATSFGGGGGAPITFAPVYQIGQGVSRAEVAQALSTANDQMRADLARMRNRGTGLFS